MVRERGLEKIPTNPSIKRRDIDIMILYNLCYI